jgi:hypothetical protein
MYNHVGTHRRFTPLLNVSYVALKTARPRNNVGWKFGVRSMDL